jgi:hypothetical protein
MFLFYHNCMILCELGVLLKWISLNEAADDAIFNQMVGPTFCAPSASLDPAVHLL